ncbi:transferase family-domain-containing protein [Xylaria palmicola]|nr:transferase family-domain-containing protein [Xylaria palmicola]
MILPTSYEPSPLDEVIPPLYNGIIYGFSCEDSQRERILEVLQEGYSRVLRLRPYLSSDLVRDESPDARPGSLKLLAVADLSSPSSGWHYSYAEVREAGMPQSWLDPKLLAPYVAGTAMTTKVLMGQVNWIPGGCLFTMYIAHAMADAWGAAMVTQYWAQQCREFQGEFQSKDAKSTRPWDRIPEVSGHNPSIHDIPASQESFDRLKSRPELWKLLGLHWEDNNVAPENAISLPTTIPAAAMAIPGMRTCIFSFSPEAGARLKADATPLDEKKWISTKDAMAALIWRAVMRARFPDIAQSARDSEMVKADEGGKSIISVAIDGRSLCKVPYSFINNVVYCCMTEMPLRTIFAEDQLATLASRIRGNIEAVKSDPSLIRDTNILAASIPDVRQLAIAFKDFLGRDLVTTSWIDIPFFDGIDFGSVLGVPEFMRIPRGQFGGICSLQPRKPNGEVEVFISLKGDDMDRFLEDTEFRKYAQFVCE